LELFINSLAVVSEDFQMTPNSSGIVHQLLAVVSEYFQMTPNSSEHLNQRSVCDPAKIFLTSKILVTNFFPAPPIKLKLGLQVGGRLVGKSNPLGPIKLSS
jgi:hypothetical protein